MEQYQMSSETRTLFTHLISSYRSVENLLQHTTVISWRFVACRFQMALARHSFSDSRDHESISTMNLNAILICLASCPGLLARVQTSWAQSTRKEKTHSKTCRYERNVKSNLLFENKVIAKLYIYCN